MIESLLVGSLIMAGLFFLLKYAFVQYQNIIIDELVEQTLICILETSNENCKMHLTQKLNSINIKNVLVQISKNKNLVHLNLKYTSTFNRKIEKESELLLDLETNP